MSFLQLTALLYLVGYYGFLLGFRGYLLYRRTGVNPIKNFTKTHIAGFVERVFAIGFVLISVVVLNYVFIEQNYNLLVPIPYLEKANVQMVAAVVSLSGLLVSFIAQLQMGNSWRLGVNPQEKTTLVTHHLFRFSRNPIYLGLIISYIGFFFLMPNAVSLVLVILNVVAIMIKVYLEEDYLMLTHPIAYLEYKKKVRRWL